MRLNQVTVPAIDVRASVDFYRRLGLELIVSAPHYARLCCPDGDATFSVHLADAGWKPAAGPVVYFETPTLDETVRDLQRAGIAFVHEPRDEPWLWREARLLDPAGNEVCLYWAGHNRLHPPWRIGSQGSESASADAASQRSPEVRPDQDESIDRYLAERLYEFNARATSYFDGMTFAAVKRDEGGDIVAGISGWTWGGSCRISHLWVCETLRGRGVGTSLLRAVEAYAKARGCASVLLASHSFQSPGFYERRGYSREAEIVDHPIGHSSVVLLKRLA